MSQTSQTEGEKKAADKASEREKHYKELKDYQRANVSRIVEHPPSEFHANVVGVDDEDDDHEKDKYKNRVTIHVFDGVMYLDSNGEAKFDRDSLTTLRNAVDAAWQSLT